VSDSIWKKEISFRRKRDDDELPGIEESLEPPAPKQSFLKKEISFSRKPKAEKPVAPAEPKQSLWKKEISLSRAKHDREVERLAEEAAQAVYADAPRFEPVHEGPQQPTELAEAVVAAIPDPAPAPVAEPAPAVFDLPAPPPIPVAFDLPAPPPAFEQPPAPVLEAAPAPVVEAAPEPEPAAYQPAPEPAYEPAPEAAYEPPAGAAYESVLEQPPAQWPEPAPAAVETWAAEPELPPAPPREEPVAIHPPVPADELPDLEPAVPFWKRDLSLSRSRGPKAAKPKRVKAGKTESGTPFWKKELSLGRKRDAPADEDEVTAEFDLPAPKGTPFWKRGISLPKPGLPSLGGHRAQKVVGLKIGASQLAAARVSNNGVAELQQIARQPLAAGIVVGGELRDPEALGDALKLFFARNKLPKKGVRLGIASNRIGVRILDIVGVQEEKQLANAVQFRAQEALPIPLDEALLDYRVLDESIDEQGQPVKRVLLVVAYRELVDRYISACRKAGIVLHGIDLEAFALLRSLGAPADRGGSALVAIAIGHDRSTFAVSDGRICEFTRVVDWGGSALSVALARVFDSTPSEVEELKESLSLEPGWVSDDLSPEHASAALDAVRKQIQTFARELVSSLQFYQAQPGSLGIGEIVITGGTAQLPGLAEELERLIGVHVRVGNPLARLKVGKRLAASERLGSLAVAIGLGIED
jgi:type IV pilus assembly protein PilM